jgi:hypothetical protein
LKTLKDVGLSIETERFTFTLKDKNGAEVLSTDKRKFVVSEKFTEIGFRLPTKRLFGLGQHNSQFMLKNGTYTLWAQGMLNGIKPDFAQGGVSGSHIHPFLVF